MVVSTASRRCVAQKLLGSLLLLGAGHILTGMVWGCKKHEKANFPEKKS